MTDCSDVPPTEVKFQDDPTVPVFGEPSENPFQEELSGRCGGGPRIRFVSSGLPSI